MADNAIVLQPGERLVIVSVNPDLRPTHPIYLPPTGGGGPVDPGYSPPWAQVPVDPGYGIPVGGAPRPSHPIYYPPGTQPHPSHPIALPPMNLPGGPVDPGYSPPWAQVPVDPGYGIPIDPPTEPPPVTPPADSGNWVWAWSPQLNRWVWVKVPGEGEAGPK